MTPGSKEHGAPLKIAGARLEVPAKLSETDRAALAQSLYAVHERIFSGVTHTQFCDHVIDPPARSTVIQLFLSERGETVGYCAVHLFKRTVQGREALVLRAEAGLLPEYRGRGATYGFGIRCAMAEKFRHPFTPIYYLGTLVHTSSYHLFCKYFPVVFPPASGSAAPASSELAQELADSFPDPAVTPDDPLIRDVGWVTIESRQEERLNRGQDRADVAFFKARNPGYTRGHGLVVVVPLTFRNVIAALFRRLKELAWLAIRRKKADL
ncbi:hypothetical protein AB2B41_06230 [Marimonas sp. MJW-29]|uniref:N-acetyltransferase domain-containing protein n=1 Tax=Sulfitobacter sediminis TaxID=3234186 RepID=A0ABV3RJP8_9RHOB